MKFILFGIIQGITEFLPISSDGHLAIMNRLLPINQESLPFTILLHVATLCAVIIFFHRQIISFLSDKKIIFQTIVLTLVTGVVALSIKKLFGSFMDNKWLVSFCFLLNGIILLNVDAKPNQRTYKNMTTKDSLITGFFQGISVLPGVSRSGITIGTLTRLKFAPVQAFNISFIMSIPAIAGAFTLELKDIKALHLSFFQITAGCLSAFVVGIAALYVLQKILAAGKFKVFAYYCFLVSIVNIFI